MKDITKNVLKKELQYYEKNKKEFLKSVREGGTKFRADSVTGRFNRDHLGSK